MSNDSTKGYALDARPLPARVEQLERDVADMKELIAEMKKLCGDLVTAVKLLRNVRP